MKQEKNNSILRPNPIRIIFIFLGLFCVFEIIFILSFFSSLEETAIFFTPILFVATAIFCIITLRSTFYEISSTKIVHSKLGKTSEYYWNDIIYIDENFSERNRMLLFYTKDGRDHYLVFDKNKIIYEKMLEKVHQISEEEMRRRFPNVKL